jgi:hypothetical protein
VHCIIQVVREAVSVHVGRVGNRENHVRVPYKIQADRHPHARTGWLLIWRGRLRQRCAFVKRERETQ